MQTESSTLSFEQSLSACWEKLRAQARRLTGSWQDAEDLVQEALTKAYSAWPSFRGEASFATWVHRIMSNVYKDRLKQGSRLRLVSLDNDGADLKQLKRYLIFGEDLTKRLEIQELRLSIAKAFADLPNQYRRLLVMKYIKHLSYEELAQSFECSIESIRCRLYRARLEMRRLLAESL